MKAPRQMRIETGFPERQRAQVAALFWQAFSGKLGRVMAPETRAIAFIEHALCPEHALTAQSPQGALLGVAGLKTLQGGLISGSFSDLAKFYGTMGALWRGPLLDLTDSPLSRSQMLLDGLFVESGSRSSGVGSALIQAVIDEARRRGLSEVRLEVVDTNLRARALYERHGFVPAGRSNLRIFRPLFGFHHSTTMSFPVAPH